MRNLLVCTTGSVASLKIYELVEKLLPHFNIKVVATKASLHFFDKSLLATKYNIQVFDDEDEWNSWNKISDPVLHIDLKKWAHILLFAPLSANSLAKLSNGICDNLPTCVFRAWDFNSFESDDGDSVTQTIRVLRFPVLVCPAMNTYMFLNPITERQLSSLKGLGVLVLDPVEKKLACGDVGVGAMAHVDSIVARLLEFK